MSFKVSFSNSNMPAVEVPSGGILSEYLTAENSPILFGCRIGICGTCVVKVVKSEPDVLHERTDNEKEYLEALAPDEKDFRLACQISLNTNITIERASL